MLRYLQVNNLAIIDAVEMEFGDGMTVFTGETGAGKSILIEALGLALGDRADTGMIRAGSDQATVSAIFAPPADPAFTELLDAHGIAAEDELIVKRQIGSDGRSRAFINGSPVALTVLRTIGEQLADIHGQHEHHSLLRRDAQRDLLDGFGGHDALLAEVATHHARVREVDVRLARIDGAGGNADRDAELLRFQVGELKALRPSAEGIAAIESEHRRLANAGRLAEGCSQLLGTLGDDDGNAQTLIDHARRELQLLARLDPAFADVTSMLETASIQVGEALQWLRHYHDRLEADPRRVAQVEEQLAALHDAARKHRVRADELPGMLQQLESRLFELEHGAELRQQLRAERQTALDDYTAADARLHEARRKAASALATAVTGRMHELGMGGGQFDVAVEAGDTSAPTAHGSDRIEFLVSANPGQPLKPLSKVASGGELSRISLAIQVLGAQRKGASGVVPTFVFDEVDVGIGGRVAEIVGRMLRALGASGQVLCVTHLPQVAALGHHHVRITKSANGGATHIDISLLDRAARIDELARMLGGVTITKQTVAHARAMLEASS
jgi:DNA repair protein RecN (Recombination protein N)